MGILNKYCFYDLKITTDLNDAIAELCTNIHRPPPPPSKKYKNKKKGMYFNVYEIVNS